MGSDSLGTVDQPLVDPRHLLEYFDPETLKLKEDVGLEFSRPLLAP